MDPGKSAESVPILKMRHFINADAMTAEELHQKLEAGYRDIEKGRVQNAAEAFEEFQKKHEIS